MSLKKQFPNEAVLRSRLEESWGDFDTQIEETVGPLEAEYKRVKKRQKIGGACLVAVFVIIGFADVFDDSNVDIFANIFGTVTAVLFFPVILVLGVVGYLFMQDKNGVVRRFNLDINKLLYPKVLSIFELSASYVEPTLGEEMSKELAEREVTEQKAKVIKLNLLNDNLMQMLTAASSPETKQVKDLLDHSELVTEPRNTVVVDDMVHIEWGSGALFLSELDLKHITGSGKNRKVKNIFSGYFVSFDTNKQLTGKTFVSTEGDRKGFGHKSFWKGVTSGNEVKETQLEWNDFEKLLHVATNNPTEARYVLTTDFMADLYDWWQGKKGNIRISFIGTRMYMLFPDKGIRFNKTIPALETTALQEYAMTIAKPLMHVLHLIEDVDQKK